MILSHKTDKLDDVHLELVFSKVWKGEEFALGTSRVNHSLIVVVCNNNPSTLIHLPAASTHCFAQFFYISNR